MAFLLNPAVASLVSGGLSFLGGMIGSRRKSTPPPPPPPMAPPAAPVSISQTASRERSRLLNRTPRPTMATSGAAGLSVGALGGGVSARPTLLGQ